MTIWYLDYLNGTDAICGTGSGDSFATRRKRFDNMGPYVVNGDTVRVMKGLILHPLASPAHGPKALISPPLYRPVQPMPRRLCLPSPGMA